MGVDNDKTLQRACNPCVTNAVKAMHYKERLTILGENLHALGGAKEPDLQPLSSLEGAVAFCENALDKLEQARDSHESSKIQLQKLTEQYQNEVRRADDAQTESLRHQRRTN